jgi:general secretion pathway protein D
VIDQLDRRRAQVYVETLVVEVSARRLLEMGVQWQSLAGLAQDGSRLVGNSNFAHGSQSGIVPSTAAQGGFAAFASHGLNIGISRGALTIPGLGPVLNLGMLARALETSAQGNVLSNPTLMATDNEKARIEVGQEISIQTGQYASSGSSSTVQPFSTYERKKIGFKLEIVPQISQGGSIRMKILQEASALDPGSAASLTTPVTNIRAVETSVTVEDGGMIAIGGLIQETVSDHQHKVPLLGDIPWLGWLFRYQNKERRKTNLLVFLKPTIVRDDLGARAIAEDRYRYIIGESLGQAGRPLPLGIRDALESLPGSLRQALPEPQAKALP